MSDSCDITTAHYLRALLQLLPRGYAWQWTKNSAGSRVLAVIAEELNRSHKLLCEVVEYSVDRFADGVGGWSAEDYEHILQSRFDINATVYPTTAVDDPHLPTVSERNKYRFIIDPETIDDLDKLNQLVRDYLDEYKQSHTDYWIRVSHDTALSATPSAGIMAIKFDKWEGLQNGANTADSADMGLSIFAKQTNNQINININTESKTKSGMHVFTHVTG